jgi:hypothetical protein
MACRPAKAAVLRERIHGDDSSERIPVDPVMDVGGVGLSWGMPWTALPEPVYASCPAVSRGPHLGGLMNMSIAGVPVFRVPRQGKCSTGDHANGAPRRLLMDQRRGMACHSRGRRDPAWNGSWEFSGPMPAETFRS